MRPAIIHRQLDGPREVREVLAEDQRSEANHVGKVLGVEGPWDIRLDHAELARLCFLGNAYAMAGRMDDARKQLAEMHKSKDDVPDHHVWFAELYAALGDKDEAFHRLDQALAAREAWLPHLRFDPGLINIRSDPRFAELHRKMGLGHVDLSLPTTEP